MASSSSSAWDSSRAKGQLRLTAQRLGQLQDRKDSLAHITSKDIATLLGQRNVSLARAKALNLMKEETVSNALEVLEMYCGVVLERFAELEKNEIRLQPPTVEAAATIIYAASFAQSQDLILVRDTLMERLGPDFAQSALHNSDGHVSQRVLRLMHSTPSADEIDSYLHNIARKFGVDWKPQMKTDEKLSILSEILDASNIMDTVDLQKLRMIASSGIPMEPSWLRPRVWKLLLGTMPLMKVRWEIDSRKRRDDYYDLIRRLLANIASLPPPTKPLSASDAALLSLAECLTRVPAHLFRGLEEEVEESPFCPIHESSLPDIKIDCAFSLDSRLQLIQDKTSTDAGDSSFDSTPEIRLDSGSGPTSPQDSSAENDSQTSKTLSSSNTLAPKVLRGISAHPTHASALIRLLYVHKSLNPGAESPHLASLLVPMYAVMNQEAEPAELAHAEADVFWLFETLIREVSELEEAEGGLVWMKKFRERLALVDNELLEDLTLKGLDPGLPQYSYRWLAPVLSHTLPLPSVVLAWDAIFSQPEMSRQSNPKLEHLLDICTAMLVRARARLLLLGKGGRKSPGLWDIEPSALQRQALRPWELGDAFMEGMTLLQNYPIDAAGGMQHVLQVAADILIQREQLSKPPEIQNVGLGAKIRETVWRGITNQTTEESISPEDSDDDTDDETETESVQTHKSNVSATSSAGSGWGSYLKSAVIRGITNESAMEVPPSPVASPGTSSLPSPVPSPTRSSPQLSPKPSLAPTISEEKSSQFLTPPSTGAGLWGYAEKLRQSDMAAKLAKASTNLSAKALDAWSARSAPAQDAPTFDTQREESVSGTSTGRRMAEHVRDGIRHGSVPNIDRSELYSPPPRPAFFKPPRDTRLFTQEEMDSLKIPDSPESNHSSLSNSTLSVVGHTKSESFAALLPSWADLQPKSPKPTKSAPKPLLLSASSLVATSSASHMSRSENSTPTPRNPDWSEVMRDKAMSLPRHRDSQFSQSSVSSRTSNPMTSPREAKSGWDSDQSISRVVRLNRQSISPMAPAFRIARSGSRNPSVSSQSEFGMMYKTASDSSPREVRGRLHDDEIESRPTRSWDRVSPDSPSTLPSSPPPRTPVTNTGLLQSSVRVANAEHQRGSLVLSESGLSNDQPSQNKKLPRKPSSPVVDTIGDTSDSSIPSASPLTRSLPRVRTKRFNGTQSRPLSVRTRDTNASSSAISIPKTSPRTLAAPEFDSELDVATTPKAAQFPSTSPTDMHTRSSPRRRKISMEDPERRRKLSSESTATRTRKLSGESRSGRGRKVSGEGLVRRDSHAEFGDDEGYDELLSAYESEEGSKYESASSEA